MGTLALLADALRNYRLGGLLVCKQSVSVIHSHGRECASWRWVRKAQALSLFVLRTHIFVGWGEGTTYRFGGRRRDILFQVTSFFKLNRQHEDPIHRFLGPTIITKAKSGEEGPCRQTAKTNQTEQCNWKVRRENVGRGLGQVKRMTEGEMDNKAETNLMDKKDTGTSKDTNSDHSPDSSIHSCKEERKKLERGCS